MASFNAAHETDLNAFLTVAVMYEGSSLYVGKHKYPSCCSRKPGNLPISTESLALHTSLTLFFKQSTI
jgi:hypothetical protein